jgi:hypothetical protein
MKQMRAAFKYLEDEFTPGQEITPQQDHLHGLSEDKKKAETCIRRADDRGDLRAHAIFVFENRRVAEDLLGKTKGKHLYEVAVNSQQILHRADLRIYDEIVEALRHDQPVDHLLKEFWEGVERPFPRIELAVSKIVIRRKVVRAAAGKPA